MDVLENYKIGIFRNTWLPHNNVRSTSNNEMLNFAIWKELIMVDY